MQTTQNAKTFIKRHFPCAFIVLKCLFYTLLGARLTAVFTKKFAPRLYYRGIEGIYRKNSADSWESCGFDSGFDSVKDTAPRHSVAIYLSNSGVGDYLMFSPLLPFIRRHFSKSYLTLIGGIRWKELVLAFEKDYIDEFICVNNAIFALDDGGGVIVNRYFQQRYFDMAIFPYRFDEWIDKIAYIINAREKIASYGDIRSICESMRADTRAYTRVIYPPLTQVLDTSTTPPQSLHIEKPLFEIYRYKHFFEILFGYGLPTPNIKFPLESSRFKDIHFDFSKPFAAIFIGSTDKERMWNLAHYAQVCAHLFSRYGIISYIFGTKNEDSLARQITNDFIISRCGAFNLVEIIYILSRAKIVIGGDAGGFHCAMRVSKNIVVISGGGVFTRFVNYPEALRGKTTLSAPLPQNALDNPYSEYIFSSKMLDSITPKEVCAIIDREHSESLTKC